jgi:hypothetical protein
MGAIGDVAGVAGSLATAGISGMVQKGMSAASNLDASALDDSASDGGSSSGGGGGEIG